MIPVDILAIVIAVISVIAAIAAFMSVEKIKARMEAIEKAPVLRQYVERFVPYDDSDESRKRLSKKMEESAKEFEESLGLTSTKVNDRRMRNEANILKAEDLV